MGFKLVAFGFNAHGQLCPSQSAPAGHIPGDIHAPVTVATASRSLRVIFASWSDTLLEIDGALRFRGAIACGGEVCVGGDGGGGGGGAHFVGGEIASGFGGDHSGLCGVVNSRGEVFLVEGYGTSGVRFSSRAVEGVSVDHVAVSGNGQVCSIKDKQLSVHASTSSFLTGSPPPTSTFALDSPAAHLTASQSAFAFLSASGTIYTFGDGRHSHLGRSPHALAPAREPGVVDALDGIRISAVATAGWLSAAVSAERDLYVWGGARDEVLVAPEEVELVHRPEEVDGVAVGDGHVVAWCPGGKVWGVGGSLNGQLGRKAGWEREWREIGGVCASPDRVREVVCGGWGTFVVVESTEGGVITKCHSDGVTL